MSSADYNDKPSGYYRKPRFDIYSLLLLVAWIALLLGIVLLYLEMELYDFEFRGGPTVSIISDQVHRVAERLLG